MLDRHQAIAYTQFSMAQFMNIAFPLLMPSHYIDGLVQDCSISIANALELLQSHIKPSGYIGCT